MLGEVGELGEAPSALRARIWLLPCVTTLVDYEFCPGDEGLAAFCAGIRLYARVDLAVPH